MTQAEARKAFDEELNKLQEDLRKMGLVVEEMLDKAIRALETRDVNLAEETINMDDIVDRYNFAIESTALKLLALQQPMARDLRTIAAALYIIKDVERMGDYALDIAKTARKLAPLEPVRPLVLIPKMAEIVRGMLHDSLQAFVNHDIDVIAQVARQDDEVDALYREVRDKMIDVIRTDPQVALPAVELILAARYLERIADHITNVGERIYYMETGELKELHDQSSPPVSS